MSHLGLSAWQAHPSVHRSLVGLSVNHHLLQKEASPMGVEKYTKLLI